MESFTIGIIIAIIIGLIAAYMLFMPSTSSVEVPQQKSLAAAQPPSILDQFTMTKGKDLGGSDIGCFKDNSPAEFCAAKCLTDPRCKAVNRIIPGTAAWGGVGGCCYKTAAAPLGVDENAIFYTRN